MSDNRTAATDTRTTVLHYESGVTRRVLDWPGENEGTYRWVLQRLNAEDGGGAQDFSEEDNPNAWRVVGTSYPRTWSTPAEALEAGADWLHNTWLPNGKSEATLEWVQESLFPLLVGVAADAGLDSAGWSFGQHAGLSWTIMDKAPGQGRRRLGIWQRWQQARFGIEGMIEALREISYQADLARAAAMPTPAPPPDPGH